MNVKKLSPTENSFMFYSEAYKSLSNQDDKETTISQSLSNIMELIITLGDMGFKDERVEKAIIYGNVKCIEQIMQYLVPNSLGAWEHKFMPDKLVSQPDKCIKCMSKQKQRKNRNKKI